MNNIKKGRLQTLLLLLFIACITTGYAQKNKSAKKHQPAKNEATETITTLTWTADNGNGTFTNPLFYDEFSDTDLIRVRQ